MTLVVFGLFVALGVVALLVPSARSEFIAGAFFASAGWAVAYFMEMMSGAVPASMGEMAEGWTATELRRLRRWGWRVAHSVRLDRRGDIDRVARNARLVRLTLPRVSPVTPVVVLWGYPEPPEAIRQVDGVVVVHGSDFAQWLGGQANFAPSVDVTEVDAAWGALTKQAGGRDRHEAAVQPEPITVTRTMTEVAIGGIGGFAAATLAVGMIGMWYLLFSLPLAAATWWFRTRTKYRTVLAALTVAIGTVAVELALIAGTLFVDLRLS